MNFVEVAEAFTSIDSSFKIKKKDIKTVVDYCLGKGAEIDAVNFACYLVCSLRKPSYTNLAGFLKFTENPFVIVENFDYRNDVTKLAPKDVSIDSLYGFDKNGEVLYWEDLNDIDPSLTEDDFFESQDKRLNNLIKNSRGITFYFNTSNNYEFSKDRPLFYTGIDFLDVKLPIAHDNSRKVSSIGSSRKKSVKKSSSKK